MRAVHKRKERDEERSGHQRHTCEHRPHENKDNVLKQRISPETSIGKVAELIGIANNSTPAHDNSRSAIVRETVRSCTHTRVNIRVLLKSLLKLALGKVLKPR
jgi:hypothetical protein